MAHVHVVDRNNPGHTGVITNRYITIPNAVFTDLLDPSLINSLSEAAIHSKATITFETVDMDEYMTPEDITAVEIEYPDFKNVVRHNLHSGGGPIRWKEVPKQICDDLRFDVKGGGNQKEADGNMRLKRQRAVGSRAMTFRNMRHPKSRGSRAGTIPLEGRANRSKNWRQREPDRFQLSGEERTRRSEDEERESHRRRAEEERTRQREDEERESDKRRAEEERARQRLQEEEKRRRRQEDARQREEEEASRRQREDERTRQREEARQREDEVALRRQREEDVPSVREEPITRQRSTQNEDVPRSRRETRYRRRREQHAVYDDGPPRPPPRTTYSHGKRKGTKTRYEGDVKVVEDDVGRWTQEAKRDVRGWTRKAKRDVEGAKRVVSRWAQDAERDVRGAERGVEEYAEEVREGYRSFFKGDVPGVII